MTIVRNTVRVTVVAFQIAFVRYSIAVAIVPIKLAAVRNARTITIFRRFTHIRGAILVAIGQVLAVIRCAIDIAIHFTSVDHAIRITVWFTIIGNPVGITVVAFGFTTVGKSIAIAIFGRLALIGSSVGITVGQTFAIIRDSVGVAVTGVFAGIGDTVAVTVLLTFVRNTIGITVVPVEFAAIRHA